MIPIYLGKVSAIYKVVPDRVVFTPKRQKKSESGASDERRAYLSYASLELTTGHKLVEFQRPQLAPINH